MPVVRGFVRVPGAPAAEPCAAIDESPGTRLVGADLVTRKIARTGQCGIAPFVTGWRGGSWDCGRPVARVRMVITSG